MRVPEHSVRTLPRREYPVHFVSVSCHIFRIAGYLSVVRTSLFAQNTCNLQRAASKPAVDQSAQCSIGSDGAHHGLRHPRTNRWVSHATVGLAGLTTMTDPHHFFSTVGLGASRDS